MNKSLLHMLNVKLLIEKLCFVTPVAVSISNIKFAHDITIRKHVALKWTNKGLESNSYLVCLLGLTNSLDRQMKFRSMHISQSFVFAILRMISKNTFHSSYGISIKE